MASDHPERLGKYQVLEHVATGPFADVYKARLDGIAGFRRTFAIKHVRASLANQPDAIARIEEEARRAGGLAHSNIVQVLDLGREDDRLFLVLEWVDGWNLTRVLQEAAEHDQRMPVFHAVWTTLQILKALEYAHQPPERTGGTELLHEALSSNNVLVSRGGELKVCDFGLGRASDALASADDGAALRLGHLSPEQLAGEAVTPATDLFAVGMLLYTCLTGQHPFQHDDADLTRAAITSGSFTPITELRDDVPDAVVEAIHSCLAVEPSARPSSATTLKDALADVMVDAGDVFTQEHLGAWLTSLFGEVDPTHHPGISIQAELPDDLLVDDEPLHLPELLPHDDRTAPAIDDTELPQPDDDDIRTAVGGVEAKPNESKTAPWHEGGQSVVSPDIAAKLTSLKTATPEPSEEDALAATAKSLGHIELGDPVELAKGVWVGGAISGLVAMLVGVALGIAGTFWWISDVNYVVLPPHLEVRAPADVVVQIDGKPAVGPVALTPGQHALSIAGPHHAASEADITLVAGEYRVIVVEPPIEAHPAATDVDAPTP